MEKFELNDDCAINITLPNAQWNIILDWLAHSPYQEAKTIVTSLNEQIQKADSTAETFTGSLSINQSNTVIFGLALGPYYVVADVIQSIYQQGQQEIDRLRELSVQTAVENSEMRPDNINTQPQEKKTTKRRTSKKKAE